MSNPPDGATRPGLLRFLLDRDYLHQLVRYGFPVALQQAAVSLLNMVGVVMIGQKGDVAMAAVGLAGQIFFLLNLVLFGIGSGSAIFTAQLWGKKDLPTLRRVLSLSLKLGLSVSLVFVGVSVFAPRWAIAIYSGDPQVIQLGGQYLSVFAWSFLFFTVTYLFSMILRSTGEVNLPMVVSLAALLVNVALTYALVFGRWGLPEFGVTGAALATVISRALECATLLAVIYLRRSAAAASLRELFSFEVRFVAIVLKPVLPVILNECLWSTGTTAYSAIYAHMGTTSIVAINMIATIDNLAFAFITALTTATAIMVGHRIGQGEEQDAHLTSTRSLAWAAATGVSLGLVALLISGPFLTLYKVSPSALDYARTTLLVFGIFLGLRATNSILIVGVLRSGGDTRFCLFIDGTIIWLLGVPSALLAAFVFHLPVYLVYLLTMSEEAAKCLLGLRRFASRKWIHNLARRVSPNTIPAA